MCVPPRSASLQRTLPNVSTRSMRSSSDQRTSASVRPRCKASAPESVSTIAVAVRRQVNQTIGSCSTITTARKIPNPVASADPASWPIARKTIAPSSGSTNEA